MPQVVEFEGARHEFPDDFSQSDISKALGSLHPQSQAPNPEGLLGGIWRSVSGLLGGPRPTAGDWAKVAITHMAAMRDQLKKAEDAHSKGYDVEAVGHLLGTALPAAAHAGETMGGTEAQYDKYGNIVKQGLKPDIAGGVGEAIPLVALTSPENEAALPGAVVRGAKAVGRAASAPGVAKIALGTGETALGGAAMLHGNLWGIYPLARGAATLQRGFAQRAAAAAEAAAAPSKAAEAARVAELEQFAPGYSKLSPKDKATTEMAYQRLKNGPPPETPPAGPISGFSQQFMPPEAPPVSPQAPSAQPSATVSPEKTPQTSGGPAGGTGKDFPAEGRATRAKGASDLADAFQKDGKTADDLRKLRIMRWPDEARRLGISFPSTHEAQLNWMHETIRQLEARETAKP